MNEFRKLKSKSRNIKFFLSNDAAYIHTIIYYINITHNVKERRSQLHRFTDARHVGVIPYNAPAELYHCIGEIFLPLPLPFYFFPFQLFHLHHI
jgi:hypothetical protein